MTDNTTEVAQTNVNPIVKDITKENKDSQLNNSVESITEDRLPKRKEIQAQKILDTEDVALAVVSPPQLGPKKRPIRVKKEKLN